MQAKNRDLLSVADYFAMVELLCAVGAAHSKMLHVRSETAGSADTRAQERESARVTSGSMDKLTSAFRALGANRTFH